MSGHTGHQQGERTVTTSDNNQETRNWVRIAALAVAPTLVAGLVAVSLSGSGTTASAETIPTTTTTTVVVEESGYSFDGDDYTLDQVDWDQPADQLPEPGEEITEEPALEEDEPMGDGPDDPPAAPLLITDEAATMDSDGYGFYNVSNGGEETLTLIGINVNGAPIELIPGEFEFGAYDGGIVEFQLDMSEVPLGPYEYTITQMSNGGTTDIKVAGFKSLVVVFPSADLDFGTDWVLPHEANHIQLEIVNNEDHVVEFNLDSDDDRLWFPTFKALEPGVNVIHIWVTYYFEVNPNVIDVLELEASWDNTSEMITIVKHGS